MWNDSKIRLPLPVLVFIQLCDFIIPHQSCRNLGQLCPGNMLAWTRIVPLSPLYVREKKTSQLGGEYALPLCVGDEKVTSRHEIFIQLSDVVPQPPIRVELSHVGTPKFLGVMHHAVINRQDGAFWKVLTADSQSARWSEPRQRHGNRAKNAESFFDASLEKRKLLSIGELDDTVPAETLCSLCLFNLSTNAFPGVRMTIHEVNERLESTRNGIVCSTHR